MCLRSSAAKEDIKLPIAAGAKTSPASLLYSGLRGDTAITDLMIRAGADINAVFTGRMLLSWVRNQPRHHCFDELTPAKRQEMFKYLEDHGGKA